MCASVYAAALACSTKSPDLPPVEARGNPAAICQLNDPCNGAEAYCVATAGPGCKYLACIDDAWHCPPEGGLPIDSGTSNDAAEASTDAAAAESSAGDAARDASFE